MLLLVNQNLTGKAVYSHIVTITNWLNGNIFKQVQKYGYMLPWLQRTNMTLTHSWKLGYLYKLRVVISEEKSVLIQSKKFKTHKSK